MNKKKALEEYKKELDILSISKAEKAELLKVYEEENALEEEENATPKEESEEDTNVESDGEKFRRIVHETSFADKNPEIICEKLDNLFYFVTSGDLDDDEKEQVKQKIESGILRLKVLKAGVEAEHYNKKILKYEVGRKIRKKNETRFFIGLGIFVIVICFVCLIIDYYTDGEFFKTRFPWEK
ncbi:MAG: hypothetical protein AB7V36_02110 [Bacteroidales bacterium]